ncbi:MAG TPA: mycothiol synthase [Iamia sp.]|nr:mycothiol synthase [Iamia sp.]
MTDLDLAPDAGRVVGADDLRVSVRTRNGEAWLTGPDPLDAPLDGDRAEAFAALLTTLADRAEAAGATAVHWESDGGAESVDAVATRVGLDQRRDILRLERPLPLPAYPTPAPAVAVRPLRPGSADEAAWVAVNNRSFAGHPDQGSETLASLHRAMAEPWFAADDLLLLDGDPPVDAGGRLDGFCWVKVHPASAEGPAAGEIYVIGVDPDAGGRGLGRALVSAGLDHMVGHGLTRALLYVDADNAPARRLYDRLGFTLAATRRVRSRRRTAAPRPSRARPAPGGGRSGDATTPPGGP